jgi:hypothetical protein
MEAKEVHVEKGGGRRGKETGSEEFFLKTGGTSQAMASIMLSWIAMSPA